MENNMCNAGSNVWLLWLLPFLIFISLFSTGSSHISTEFTNEDECCHKAIRLKTCRTVCMWLSVENYKHCGAIIRINLKKRVRFGSNVYSKSVCTLSSDPWVLTLIKNTAEMKKPMLSSEVSHKRPPKLPPSKFHHFNGTKSIAASVSTLTISHRTQNFHGTRSARLSTTTGSMHLAITVTKKSLTELPTTAPITRATISPNQHILHTPAASTWLPVLTAEKPPSESSPTVFPATSALSSKQSNRKNAKRKKGRVHPALTGSMQSKLRNDVTAHADPHCGTSCYVTTTALTSKSDTTHTPQHSVSPLPSPHPGLTKITKSVTALSSSLTTSQRTHTSHGTRRVRPSAPTSFTWLSVIMSRNHLTEVPPCTATRHKTPHLHHMKTDHKTKGTMIHTPVGFTQATVMTSEKLLLEPSSTVVSTCVPTSKHYTAKNIKGTGDTFHSVLRDSMQPTSTTDKRPYTDSQYHPSSLSAMTKAMLASDITPASLSYLPSSQPPLTNGIQSAITSPSMPAASQRVHAAGNAGLSDATNSIQVSVMTVKHFEQVHPTTSAMSPDLHSMKTGHKVQGTVLHILRGSMQPSVITAERSISESPSIVVTNTSAPSSTPDTRKTIKRTEDTSHSVPVGSVPLTLTRDMAPHTGPQYCSFCHTAMTELTPKSDGNNISQHSVSQLPSSPARLNDDIQSVTASSPTLITLNRTRAANKTRSTTLFATTSSMQVSEMTSEKHLTDVLPTTIATSPDLHSRTTHHRMVDTVFHTLRSSIQPPVITTEKSHSGASPSDITPTPAPSSKSYGTKTVEKTRDIFHSVPIDSTQLESIADRRPHADASYCSSCLSTTTQQMITSDVSHTPQHSVSHLSSAQPGLTDSMQSVTALPSMLITSQRNQTIHATGRTGLSAATGFVQLVITEQHHTDVPTITVTKSADLHSMKSDHRTGDTVPHTLRNSMQPSVMTTETSPSKSPSIVIISASTPSSKPDTRKNKGTEAISNSLSEDSVQQQTDSQASTTVIMNAASSDQSPRENTVHYTDAPLLTDLRTAMNDKIKMMSSTLSSPKLQEQSTLQAMLMSQPASSINDQPPEFLNPAHNDPDFSDTLTGNNNDEKNDSGSQKDKIIFLLLGVLLSLAAVLIYSLFKLGKKRQTQCSFNEGRPAPPFVSENGLLIPYILNMEHITWKDHSECSSSQGQCCITPEQECQTPLLLNNSHVSNETFHKDTKL